MDTWHSHEQNKFHSTSTQKYTKNSLKGTLNNASTDIRYFRDVIILSPSFHNIKLVEIMYTVRGYHKEQLSSEKFTSPKNGFLDDFHGKKTK